MTWGTVWHGVWNSPWRGAYDSPAGGRWFRDIPPEEDKALRDLYAATDGPNWTNNDGWGPGTFGYTGLAADAFGVTVAGGTVTKIEMTGNGLVGTFPVVDLPRKISHFYANNCSAFILSGSLRDFPPSAIWLHVAYTDSTISGPMSDLPPTLQYFYTYGSNVRLWGGASPITCTGVRAFRIEDSTSQSASDSADLIARIYDDRMLFLFGAPSLNISNTSPVDAATEAKIIELSDAAAAAAEGRTSVWAITYDPPV